MSKSQTVLERLGGWLFKRRTWLPLPVVLALLVVPPRSPYSRSFLWAGVALTVAGEVVRLWAVRHIGVVSRTRSDRLGPLVSTGPFAFVRNPLYLGNIALWAGFAASTGITWLMAAIVLLLALEYHAIVRWEERLLEARVGESYRSYTADVPRWIPRRRRARLNSQVSSLKFNWRQTLFSERGTLIAIAIGYVLLWFKLQL